MSNTTSHEIEIIINGRPKKVAPPTVTFEQVLALSGTDFAGQDLGLFDIEWKWGDRAGSLTPGATLEIHNGMKIDAGKSNRS